MSLAGREYSDNVGQQIYEAQERVCEVIALRQSALLQLKFVKIRSNLTAAYQRLQCLQSGCSQVKTLNGNGKPQLLPDCIGTKIVN